MESSTFRFALVPAIVLGLLAGIAAAWLTRSEPTFSGTAQKEATAPVAGIGDRRPAFMHAGVAGGLWRASDFDGRPTLVNFWATWCTPCVREMPLLQNLAEQYPERLNVVGIAIDDPGKIGEFTERLGITYPILIGTSDVRETQALLGNPGGMLPYSVLLDAQGIIRWRQLGELEEDRLRDILQPFLARPTPDAGKPQNVAKMPRSSGN